MFENFNLNAIWDSIMDWCGIYLFSTNTLYQGIIIAVSFALAGVMYGALRSKVKKRVEEYKGPAVARRILNNLTRLLLPFFALSFIFIATEVLINVNIAIIRHRA